MPPLLLSQLTPKPGRPRWGRDLSCHRTGHVETEEQSSRPGWDAGGGQTQDSVWERGSEKVASNSSVCERTGRVHRSESKFDREVWFTVLGLWEGEVLVAVTGWFVSPGYQVVSKVRW